MRRLLLLGTTGQLGWELHRSLLPLGEVVALSRVEADFENPDALSRIVAATRPDVLVNAVAYTSVDQAESEPAQAHRINAEAVGVLAEETAKLGAILIHYSTDYVFDGTKSSPYRELDEPNPLSAYGASKLAGEKAIVASGCNYLVLRTSWIYAARGKNFVRTILKLAQERDVLRIVADQFGAPTSARLVADCTAQIIARAECERKEELFNSAILHLTASGKTSWYELANYVIENAKRRSQFPIRVSAIDAIATTEFPLPAKRPQNSCLDTNELRARFQIVLPDWKICVDRGLDELLGR